MASAGNTRRTILLPGKFAAKCARNFFKLQGATPATAKRNEDRKELVERPSNGWLAEQLHMGVRNAVSRTIRGARECSRHLFEGQGDQQIPLSWNFWTLRHASALNPQKIAPPTPGDIDRRSIAPRLG